MHQPERPAHFGIRRSLQTDFFYGQGLGKKGVSEETTEPAWEFYDLKEDPNELYNAIDENRYEVIIVQMKSAMVEGREKYGDLDEEYPVMRGIIEDNMVK